MLKIVKQIIKDILRNKVILFFTLFLFVTSFSMINLQDTPEKGMVSLMNVVLFAIPLLSLIFCVIYLYNSLEFIELILSQPVQRKTIWNAFFLSLAGAFFISILIGIGIPVVLYSFSTIGLTLVAVCILLTWVFVSIAMWIAVSTKDKARGIGKALIIWLFFSILYDGIILFLLFQFSDYPIEKPMIGLAILNPVDLCRIMLLLQFDISAMMGFTGALFKKFFSSWLGFFIALLSILMWIIIPFLVSKYKFSRKDL